MAYGNTDRKGPDSKYTEQVQRDLKTIIDHFYEADRPTRERQIREWKKLEYYWSGIQRVYWDDLAHDWRVYDQQNEYGDNQAGHYDKPVNVYRAYLESIIAALSATVPLVKCYPDDADNVNDILTAKGGTKIAKLVYDHIDADLLWIKALYTFCNQGMVAAYNYSAEDEEYGTVEVDEYKDEVQAYNEAVCPSCGKILAGEELELAESIKEQSEDEFQPGEPNRINELNSITPMAVVCPRCQFTFNPDIQEKTIVVTRLVGKMNKPKARQIIVVNGGLFVNVPNWARNQSEIPYLEYAYETHYSNVLAKYPWLRDNLGIKGTEISSSDNEFYGRWGRLSPQYAGDETGTRNNPTCRNWWLRPQAFEIISDESNRKKLYELFPDGACVVFVNDRFADARPENLDDCWTLTFNPLSEYVHFDPLGILLVSVQDITNDLISLSLQTIEHGIPTTFVDPSVVNLEQYADNEIAPGSVFPAKPKGGKSLGESFYTVDTASLGREVDPFAERINQLGQLTSGALPTLFGGSLPSAQRTAAQYQMSRNQALQRLQTTWKIFNVWWKKVFGKVIPAYIKGMIEDERIVQPKGDNFVNIVIKKAEMDGKIGSVHLESSEELPKTWSQVRDMVMELIKLGNPDLLALLGAPENLEVMQKVFGPTGLKIPNEADREKQLDEINVLLRSEPQVIPPQVQGMQPMFLPTVMPDQDIDNHAVEAEICRDWLVGEAGRQAKTDNQGGYQNVLAHFRMHKQFLQMQMMQQMQQQSAMQPNKPPTTGSGEENAGRSESVN